MEIYWYGICINLFTVSIRLFKVKTAHWITIRFSECQSHCSEVTNRILSRIF